MPVFRYDTRDVVRCLPTDGLGCELAGIPATSQVLGKADHLLRLGTEVITPRQLVEAIEALPTAPWPARYRATVPESRDGRIQLTLPASAISGFGEAEARRQLAGALGAPDLDLVIVADDQAASLRRTRSDLHETTFATAGA
jgi:phenylacetate-coenzyme A ligase PaaK-like adenylate-forming protein